MTTKVEAGRSFKSLAAEDEVARELRRKSVVWLRLANARSEQERVGK